MVCDKVELSGTHFFRESVSSGNRISSGRFTLCWGIGSGQGLPSSWDPLSPFCSLTGDAGPDPPPCCCRQIHCPTRKWAWPRGHWGQCQLQHWKWLLGIPKWSYKKIKQTNNNKPHGCNCLKSQETTWFPAQPMGHHDILLPLYVQIWTVNCQNPMYPNLM